MRKIGHLNFTYLRNRLKQWMYQRRDPSAPWLTEDMNKILSSWLKPEDIGFEWGAGRSTLWLAARIKHLTSVEQNAEWAEHVEELISNSGFESKVSLEKHFNTHGAPPDSYYEVIKKVPDSTLDFCLVDGDLRDRCANFALDKLKSGGILVIDNAERYLYPLVPSSAPGALDSDKQLPSGAWKEFIARTVDWRCIWSSDGVSDTALYVKP